MFMPKALLLFFFFIPALYAQNILFIDSSFPPLVSKELKFRPPTCPWLREDNAELAQEGPCYDVADWENVDSEDLRRLKGLVDSLSGKETAESLIWKKTQAEHPEAARELQGRFSLAVHGTRAIAVAQKSSGSRIQPLAMRNLTAKAGADIQSSAPVTMPSIPARHHIPRQPYSNGCPLTAWTQEELKAFAGEGALQIFQQRIAQQLADKPSLRVVNISLGYKRSWIAEDFPKCNKAQVNKEYDVLTASWRNLLRQFPDRLFVVAAGNESENFDKPELKANDAWAFLSSEENLLLVGSMTLHGARFASSNYGLPVSIFALGEGIPALTPLPKEIAGRESTLRGTSFSAPLVAGQAVALWTRNSKLSLAQLREQLIESFRESQFKVIFPNFEKKCKGESQLDLCLDIISELISRPLLWAPIHELYLEGRRQWDFRPFALQFHKDLPTLGQTRLLDFKGQTVPAIFLKTSENPYELLITLYHELYHYSQIHKAGDKVSITQKVDECITPYQLMLLQDEIPAYKMELDFYELSPSWFKKKLSQKKYPSQIFEKNLNASQFYSRLKQELDKNPHFVVKRLIDLGHYPPCALKYFVD
jgi:hypothetical protein